MKTMIIKPRCMGKTTEIIEEVKAHNGILLVHNEREADRIKRLDKDMKDKVMSWHNIKEKLKGKHRPIFIDNAEFLLQELIGIHKLKGISMTIGE